MTMNRPGFQRTVLAVPSVVGLLRDQTESVLRKWGLDHITDDAKIIVSELATNATAEGVARGREIVFRMTDHGDQVSIEITDPSPLRPRLRHAADTDVHGRGLFIVQALAVATGYRDE